MAILRTMGCLLASCVFTVSIACAETMTIGNYAINYTVPDGYVELNKNRDVDRHYLSTFDTLYKTMQSSLTFVFVRKDYYEHMSITEPLVEYAVAYYMNPFADIFFSDDDFDVLKKGVVAELSSGTTTFDIADTNITMTNQTVLRDEQNIFSLSQFATPGGEAPTVFSVLTGLNIDGKILFITYNRQFKNQTDIDEIIASSDNFVTALHLAAAEGQQRRTPGFGTVTKGVAQVGTPVLMIVGGVTLFMALPLGLIFFFMKRGEKKRA